MKTKHVFVTVGTTKFQKLITALSDDNTLEVLSQLGYSSIQFQTGSGYCRDISSQKLNIQCAKYFENFSEEIKKSDLVISHAGAGTCLEVLQHGKPLIVVINEDLMDNHQIELAKQLSKEGYLHYCTCDSLKETLEKDLKLLKPYPVSDSKKFANYLDWCMGYQ